MQVVFLMSELLIWTILLEAVMIKCSTKYFFLKIHKKFAKFTGKRKRWIYFSRSTTCFKKGSTEGLSLWTLRRFSEQKRMLPTYETKLCQTTTIYFKQKIYWKQTLHPSSRLQVFGKKPALKTFVKSTRKDLQWSPF